MAKKLTIRRKAYRRKGYRRKDGTWVKGSKVKASTFQISDRGRPGRGPKSIQIQKEGALGGPGYTDQSVRDRHLALSRSMAQSGYATTMWRLNAIHSYGKRTMSPTKLRRLERDIAWLKKNRPR